MTKYNESLTKAGVLLGLDGLHPPAKGTRVKFAGGKPKVTDGPFTESKELVGGYWMIQVKSKEEAVEWARRAPMQDGDIIEGRQGQEIEDFPADVRKAAGGGATGSPRSGRPAGNRGGGPRRRAEPTANPPPDRPREGRRAR